MGSSAHSFGYRGAFEDCLHLVEEYRGQEICFFNNRGGTGFGIFICIESLVIVCSPPVKVFAASSLGMFELSLASGIAPVSCAAGILVRPAAEPLKLGAVNAESNE